MWKIDDEYYVEHINTLVNDYVGRQYYVEHINTLANDYVGRQYYVEHINTLVNDYVGRQYYVEHINTLANDYVGRQYYVEHINTLVNDYVGRQYYVEHINTLANDYVGRQYYVEHINTLVNDYVGRQYYVEHINTLVNDYVGRQYYVEHINTLANDYVGRLYRKQKRRLITKSTGKDVYKAFQQLPTIKLFFLWMPSFSIHCRFQDATICIHNTNTMWTTQWRINVWLKAKRNYQLLNPICSNCTVSNSEFYGVLLFTCKHTILKVYSFFYFCEQLNDIIWIDLGLIR